MEKRIVQYIYSDHRRNKNKVELIDHSLHDGYVREINKLRRQVHDLKNPTNRRVIGVMIAEQMVDGIFNIAFSLCNPRDKEKFSKYRAIEIAKARLADLPFKNKTPQSIWQMYNSFLGRAEKYFKGCRMMDKSDSIENNN